ncbi:hypothetical protein ACFL6B_02885 [Thermodesulfobacteriota bacterium]
MRKKLFVSGLVCLFVLVCGFAQPSLAQVADAGLVHFMAKAYVGADKANINEKIDCDIADVAACDSQFELVCGSVEICCDEIDAAGDCTGDEFKCEVSCVIMGDLDSVTGVLGFATGTMKSKVNKNDVRKEKITTHFAATEDPPDASPGSNATGVIGQMKIKLKYDEPAP